MGNTKRSMPGQPLKSHTPYQKQKERKKFRRPAAMEPLMGHLKTEHRMGENDLMGAQSPTIKAYLAGRGWHLKKFMEPLVQEVLFAFSGGLHIQLKKLR